MWAVLVGLFITLGVGIVLGYWMGRDSERIDRRNERVDVQLRRIEEKLEKAA